MSPIGPSLEPVSQLLPGAAAMPGSLDPLHPRNLDEAARGLESAFLSILLKQMRETLGPGTLFGSDGADVYGGLFDQMMSQHLTQGKGIGLARAIKKQLETHTGHDASHGPSAAHRRDHAGPPLSGALRA